MSTYWNKWGVSRGLQVRVLGVLARTRLKETFSIVLIWFRSLPTYLETFCVHSDVSQICVVPAQWSRCHSPSSGIWPLKPLPPVTSERLSASSPAQATLWPISSGQMTFIMLLDLTFIMLLDLWITSKYLHAHGTIDYGSWCWSVMLRFKMIWL